MMMKYYKKYFDFIKEKDSKKVMWIRIQGYKIKGKAEFNQHIFGIFCRKFDYSSLKLKSSL